jgi:hypothetical protein
LDGDSAALGGGDSITTFALSFSFQQHDIDIGFSRRTERERHKTRKTHKKKKKKTARMTTEPTRANKQKQKETAQKKAAEAAADAIAAAGSTTTDKSDIPASQDAASQSKPRSVEQATSAGGKAMAPSELRKFYPTTFSQNAPVSLEAFMSAVTTAFFFDTCALLHLLNRDEMKWLPGGVNVKVVEELLSEKIKGRALTTTRVVTEFHKNVHNNMETLVQTCSTAYSAPPPIPFASPDLAFAHKEWVKATLNYCQAAQSFRDEMNGWATDPLSPILAKCLCVVDDVDDDGLLDEMALLDGADCMRPGRCDADKKKPDRGVGDFVIWKTMLAYAIKEEKDIVFVTHDNKGDWHTNGRPIPLMVNEMQKNGRRIRVIGMENLWNFQKGKAMKQAAETDPRDFELAQLRTRLLARQEADVVGSYFAGEVDKLQAMELELSRLQEFADAQGTQRSGWSMMIDSMNREHLVKKIAAQKERCDKLFSAMVRVKLDQDEE